MRVRAGVSIPREPHSVIEVLTVQDERTLTATSPVMIDGVVSRNALNPCWETPGAIEVCKRREQVQEDLLCKFFRLVRSTRELKRNMPNPLLIAFDEGNPGLLVAMLTAMRQVRIC